MRKAIQPFKTIERPIRVSVGVTRKSAAFTFMKPSEWMRRAAKLLLNSWASGLLYDKYRGKERYCMLGALAKVKTGSASLGYAVTVPQELIEVVGDVPSFNDSINNTEQDCIAALQIAADIAEVNEVAQP